MAQTVVGIYKNLHEAQKAFDNLLSSGFERHQIDLSEDYGETYNATDDRTTTDRHDDSISNFFESLFGGGRDAENHREVARRGSLITVHTETKEEAERAQDILDRFGALEVDDHAELYRSGTTEAGLDIDRTTEHDSDQSIPVIEEEVQVGKRSVETGGVRVRSRIVERPVEEHIRLRSEHVHVDRNPVDRKATAAELENFKEGEIEMTEHAEEAVVNKEARVTEEVNIRKDVEEHDETIHEDVRKTEVDVDETTADRDLTEDEYDTTRREDPDLTDDDTRREDRNFNR